MHALGYPDQEIADTLGVSLTTAWRWRDKLHLPKVAQQHPRYRQKQAEGLAKQVASAGVSTLFEYTRKKLEVQSAHSVRQAQANRP